MQSDIGSNESPKHTQTVVPFRNTTLENIGKNCAIHRISDRREEITNSITDQIVSNEYNNIQGLQLCQNYANNKVIVIFCLALNCIQLYVYSRYITLKATIITTDLIAKCETKV